VHVLQEDLRFTKEHEWIKISDSFAVVGISDFAQKQLGDIVSVELPKVGSIFKQMQVMAIVDSIKASSDIYCPLSGQIIEINEGLHEHPEWINQSPYESGWMVKMKPSNINEFENLMIKTQYEEFVGQMK
jgi:glycine cleavage system H protein